MKRLLTATVYRFDSITFAEVELLAIGAGDAIRVRNSGDVPSVAVRN